MSELLHPDEIHESVQRYYADRAEAAGSEACCAPSACDCAVYPDERLRDLPAELRDLSLGCADPVSAAGLRPGETVLDLGSGGGLDAVLAARAVGPTGRVIGVDMTEAMLSRARDNAQHLDLANLEFRRGLIEALPVDDASIDAVISNCVINLSPDKAAVFAEIHRVLRPGGRLVVADIVTAGPLPSALQAQVDAWAACVAGALTVEDYLAGLQRAGFAEVGLQPAFGAAPEDGSGLPFSAIVTARKS